MDYTLTVLVSDNESSNWEEVEVEVKTDLGLKIAMILALEQAMPELAKKLRINPRAIIMAMFGRLMEEIGIPEEFEEDDG